jgi:hypothetical protein
MKRQSHCITLIYRLVAIIGVIKLVESSFLVDEVNINKKNELESLIDNNPEENIPDQSSSRIHTHSGKNCSFQNCPLLQGVCFEDQCVCSYGFKTFIVKNEPEIYCNYKQKSRMTAFFLEFFFPIGLGHLYAGKVTLGIIKCSLFCLFFLGLCGEIMCIRLNMNKFLLCSAFTLLADMCLWIVLQIVDLICYAFGFYLDGNGLPMI